MPGSATQFTEQGVLGHTLAYAPMTAPTNIYVALCLASPAPTSTTGGLEPVGGAYARVQGTFAISATPNIAANTATLSYPTATANWGGLGYYELWSALTGGNRLYWGPLVDPIDGVTPITRTVMSGDIVRLSAGAVQVRAT